MPKRNAFLDDAALGLGCYGLSSLVVLLGVLFGHEFVKPPAKEIDRFGPEPAFVKRFLRYDAQHYRQIVLNGYDYDPDAKSSIAFFPAYPLLVRAVMRCTSCSVETALLIVAHACLAAAFVVFASLLRLRFPDHAEVRLYALGLFALCPAGLFFRMGYSESLFVLTLALSLLGMLSHWPPLLIALIIGAVTATRAAGFALVPIFALHLWRRREREQESLAGASGSAFNVALYTAIACWGFLAFSVYQHAAFGDALAWAKAHSHWALFRSSDPMEKGVSLLALEPVWGIFVPSSPRYWQHWEWHSSPLFSMIVLNPLFFIATMGGIMLGYGKQWLTGSEAILSALLVLIPYVGRAYENELLSMSRFCAVVLPAYYVLARMHAWLPPYVAALILTGSGVALCVYSCLFASGYQVF